MQYSNNKDVQQVTRGMCSKCSNNSYATKIAYCNNNVYIDILIMHIYVYNGSMKNVLGTASIIYSISKNSRNIYKCIEISTNLEKNVYKMSTKMSRNLQKVMHRKCL